MEKTPFFIALKKQIPEENLKFKALFLNQHSNTPTAPLLQLIYTGRAIYL